MVIPSEAVEIAAKLSLAYGYGEISQSKPGAFSWLASDRFHDPRTFEFPALFWVTVFYDDDFTATDFVMSYIEERSKKSHGPEKVGVLHDDRRERIS